MFRFNNSYIFNYFVYVLNLTWANLRILCICFQVFVEEKRKWSEFTD